MVSRDVSVADRRYFVDAQAGNLIELDGIKECRDARIALEPIRSKMNGRSTVVLAIADTLKLPIRWVGVGEGMGDLVPFDAAEFARALVTP